MRAILQCFGRICQHLGPFWVVENLTYFVPWLGGFPLATTTPTPSITVTLPAANAISCSLPSCINVLGLWYIPGKHLPLIFLVAIRGLQGIWPKNFFWCQHLDFLENLDYLEGRGEISEYLETPPKVKINYHPCSGSILSQILGLCASWNHLSISWNSCRQNLF